MNFDCGTPVRRRLLSIFWEECFEEDDDDDEDDDEDDDDDDDDDEDEEEGRIVPPCREIVKPPRVVELNRTINVPNAVS